MANQFMFLISPTSYLMPFWGFFYAFKKYKTINTYYSTTFKNVHLLYLFFRVTICKITSNGGQGFSHGNQPPRAVYSGIFKSTIISTLYYFIKDSFKMYLTATSFLSLCHFKLWKFPRVSCLLYTMHIAILFAFSQQPILQNQINQEKEIEIEIHKVSINSFKYCKIVFAQIQRKFLACLPFPNSSWTTDLLTKLNRASKYVWNLVIRLGINGISRYTLN